MLDAHLGFLTGSHVRPVGMLFEQWIARHDNAFDVLRRYPLLIVQIENAVDHRVDHDTAGLGL
jgi:hypothetical protein